jgi:hypothetical protein
MKKEKKTKKAKPEQPLVKERISAKYVFTPEEVQSLTKSLTDSISEKARLEEEKKTAMADWKTRISTVANNIASGANKISAGYEWRDTECQVVMDTPKKGRKSYIRLSDKVKVDERDMTDSDRQLLLTEVEKAIAKPAKEKTAVAEAFEKAEKQKKEDEPEDDKLPAFS